MKKKNDAAKRKLAKKAVSPPAKVTIRKLPTGVRGLDDILGGGIPEFSFNIIASPPGGQDGQNEAEQCKHCALTLRDSFR